MLTKLLNRSHYTEEVNRLERSSLRPVSSIYIDMNGLKVVNDAFGHDSGDDLLRRTGELLNQLVQNTQYSACRIGGDEFVVLLPGADEIALHNCLAGLQELLLIDSQFHGNQMLNLSIGSATTLPQESIEEMLKRADQAMYTQKRADQAMYTQKRAYYVQFDRRETQD